MTGPSALSPTSTTPQDYDIVLSDGSDSVGITAGFLDREGKFQPSMMGGLSRTPVNRTAIQTNQGQSKYSSLNLPWGEFVQDEWMGGRGSNDFEKDSTRFFDSSRVIPTKDGLMLGPMENFSSPYVTQMQQNVKPLASGWRTFATTALYQSISFVASATATMDEIYMPLDITGLGTSEICQVAAGIYADSAGAPGAQVGSTATFSITENGRSVYLATGLAAALTSGTTYHIVATKSSAAGTAAWGYYTTGTGSAQVSANGSSWSGLTNAYPWFRLTASDVDIPTYKFVYKRALYAVQQRTASGNSFLYRNGYRGAADSNAGNLDRLVDGTNPFTSADVVGGIVLITKGPGSEEEKPWRTVTGRDSSSGYLTVSPSWNITHTTSTEYVVIYTPIWGTGVDLGGIVTGKPAVAGEFVYFPRGNDTTVARYQEYNNAGTWTVRSVTNEDTDVCANSLLYIHHPDSGPMLYGARNGHSFFGVTMWKASVPSHWGALYNNLLTISENNAPWDDAEITNITQGCDGVHTKTVIAAGFTTGYASIHTLPAAVDLTRGDKLVGRIYSTVATNAGDLRLLLDDNNKLAYDEPQIVLFDNTGTTFREQFNLTDGNTTYFTDFEFDASDRLYIGAPSRFSAVKVSLGTTVNANASVLSANYWDGSAWVSLTITDGTASGGATLAIDNNITFTIPGDWEPGINNYTGGQEENFPTSGETGYYWIYFTVSADLTADLEIEYMLVHYDHFVTFNFPALTANTWTWYELDLTPAVTESMNYAAIRSLALYVNADNGAQDVYLGPMYLKSEKVDFQPLPGDARVLNMIAHDGNQADPRTNPWIVTENAIYEMQTQNGDALVPIPLQEIAAFASSENGKALTVNDVYLYFNLGGKLERYFGRNLDDIGPDLDEGMPSARQGVPSAIVSYPGTVFMALDGGTSNYSTVLALKGSSWYELYRAPATGMRITDLAIQALPGKPGDLLWVACGQNEIYFYISPNPLKDSDYYHALSGYVESGWHYGGFLVQPKVWKSLTVHMDSGSGTARSVYGYYKTSEYAAWTSIGTYDTIPYEEIDLAASYVNSTRIKIRLDLASASVTDSPLVKAAVINAFVVVPIKYTTRIQTLLADEYMETNLAAQPTTALGYASRVETALSKLDAWASAATVLTMTSRWSPYDNKKVILSAVPHNSVGIWEGGQNERHLLQLELNELS